MRRVNLAFWLRIVSLFGLVLLVDACNPQKLSFSSDAGEQILSTPAMPITPQMAATISITPEPTPEATATAQAPSVQATEASLPLTYPDSFYIKGIIGHVQVYELGCEASAAVDWANYFGKTIYEFNFQTELPISDNPDYGYVGDPNTDGWGQIPPYAYGVHSDPVAELLRAYDLPAQSEKGYTLEAIREELSQSKPVIVWIIGNMEYSVPVEYVDSQGRKSTVAPYEHVVILTGYDQNTVRYMSNGRFYDVPNEVFLTSWGVLGNMAIVHE